MAMYQGNWPCSQCDKMITELPFQPRSTNGLTCRDCYFNNKNGGSSDTTGGGTQPASDADTGTSAELDDRDIPDFDPDDLGAGEPAPESPEVAEAPAAAPRKMFQGNWPCSMCDKMITELPFEPRSTDGLKCLECFKKG